MDNTVLTKHGRLRASRGQSMVEFAMVVPLFFLMIFAMLDVGRILYVEMTLQNAMRQAARLAVTGSNQYNGQATNRLAAIQLTAQQASIGLIGNPGSVSVSSIQNGVVIPNDPGGPNDTVVVSLSVGLQLFTPMIGRFFPNGTDVVTVSTSFKNEPF